jgi:hypothetical protein
MTEAFFLLFTYSSIIMKNCFSVSSLSKYLFPITYIYPRHTLRMMTTTKNLCYYLVRLVSLSCLALSLFVMYSRSVKLFLLFTHCVCVSTKRSIYNKQKFSSGEAYVHRISLFFFTTTTCSHS